MDATSNNNHQPTNQPTNPNTHNGNAQMDVDLKCAEKVTDSDAEESSYDSEDHKVWSGCLPVVAYVSVCFLCFVKRVLCRRASSILYSSLWHFAPLSFTDALRGRSIGRRFVNVAAQRSRARCHVQAEADQGPARAPPRASAGDQQLPAPQPPPPPPSAPCDTVDRVQSEESAWAGAVPADR